MQSCQVSTKSIEDLRQVTMLRLCPLKPSGDKGVGLGQLKLCETMFI